MDEDQRSDMIDRIQDNARVMYAVDPFCFDDMPDWMLSKVDEYCQRAKIEIKLYVSNHQGGI